MRSIKKIVAVTLLATTVTLQSARAQSLPIGQFRGRVYGILDDRASAPSNLTVRILKRSNNYTLHHLAGFYYAMQPATFGFVGTTPGRTHLPLNGSCLGIPRVRVFAVDLDTLQFVQDIDYSQFDCFDADGPFTRQIFSGTLRRQRGR